MGNVIDMQERGGSPSLRLAKEIMAARQDPLAENTREEWLASGLLAAHAEITRLHNIVRTWVGEQKAEAYLTWPQIERTPNE